MLAPYGARGPVSVLSFGQGLQHPTAIGVAGGEPGSQSGFAIFPAAVADRVDGAGCRGGDRGMVTAAGTDVETPSRSRQPG